MSKSLKNFITINEFLHKNKEVMSNLHSPSDPIQAIDLSPNSVQKTVYSPYPAVDLRICFLLYKYNATLPFTSDVLKQAMAYRHKIEQFMFNIKRAEQYLMAVQSPKEISNPISDDSSIVKLSYEYENILLDQLKNCETEVLLSYANDFDTPGALRLFSNLMQHANQYVENLLHEKYVLERRAIPTIEPLVAVKDYILYSFELLGVNISGVLSSKNLLMNQDHVNDTDSVVNKLDAPTPVSSIKELSSSIDELVKFRSSIRKIAIEHIRQHGKDNENSTKLAKSILMECDELRKLAATRLNTDIMDVSNHLPVWKFNNS